jgi:hypothetical protein
MKEELMPLSAGCALGGWEKAGYGLIRYAHNDSIKTPSYPSLRKKEIKRVY